MTTFMINVKVFSKCPNIKANYTRPEDNLMFELLMSIKLASLISAWCYLFITF